MRIGILGTGNVARTIATELVDTGHDVLLGSREPDGRTGPGLTFVTHAKAVAHGEVIVNATPGDVSLPLLRRIGADALADKVLLDIAIGFNEDWTLTHPGTSLGELIQEEFPYTHVVKTLCTMDSTAMVNPTGLEGPSTVFLSGDDWAAKQTVGQLLGDLGWPESYQLDLGGIRTARGQEHYALLFIGIALTTGSFGFNIKVVPQRA
ncbi:NADPH-dependent F420 reductase [Streptomyces sp. NPDC021093]|uniref:NADPH-dependent F420 reductase n=1 Tax=Streptomyces sp. NPDC021093 TaxID=3365112 RepID=UPI0037BBA4AF